MVKVVKTNHGTDGWDATDTVVATFDDPQKAHKWITGLGHTVDFHGEEIEEPRVGGRRKTYYHQEENKRHTMGCISYTIRPIGPSVPHNPS